MIRMIKYIYTTDRCVCFKYIKCARIPPFFLRAYKPGLMDAIQGARKHCLYFINNVGGCLYFILKTVLKHFLFVSYFFKCRLT